MTETAATAEANVKKKVTVAGFNHISIPVRDTAEAVRFWTEIFGAEVTMNSPDVGFAEVRVGGMIFGLSTRTSGWTGHTAEYPHYGFTVRAEDMDALKQRLEAFDVPTHDIWTRLRKEALMYFRDPSGNLFELYCPQGYRNVDSVPLGKFGGGSYEPDLTALNYDSWRDPGR